MKINKISRKLIKPHTPTPEKLKKYKLSFIDKEMIATSIAVVLFYESKAEDTRWLQLEDSLAKTLVDFYPLAGRYIKNVNSRVIDCNDEGVEFVEAEAVDVELIDLVGKTHEIEQLIPGQYFKMDEAADYPLLSIQVTHFPCGGVVIAVCVAHRVFDAASLETFTAAWSSATASSHPIPVHSARMISPSFQLPSLLPCKDDDEDDGSHPFELDERKIVWKRLFFDKVALAGLISELRPRNDGKTVSRVRVACAVTAKALIRLDRAKHGRSRDFVIACPVNMRGRTTFLPQPKHSCGNFSLASITRRVAASGAEHIGIQELVDLLGDAVQKSISDHAEILSPDRDGYDIYNNTIQHLVKEFSEPDTNGIEFTDFSKFGFYDVDLGWGKPVWMTMLHPERVTMFTSSNEGDGIEVLLSLYQDEIAYFVKDEIAYFELPKFMAQK